MTLRRRIVAIGYLLTGVAVVACGQWWVHAHGPNPQSLARIGRRLPSLQVEDASGKTVDLRGLASGGKTIIVFYSPTCDVCKGELPELLPFPRTLRLVMVSESGEQKMEDTLAPRFSLVQTYYDRDGVLKRSFAMAGLPTILFVDASGVLRDGLMGAHARDLVQRKLNEFAARP